MKNVNIRRKVHDSMESVNINFEKYVNALPFDYRDYFITEKFNQMSNITFIKKTFIELNSNYFTK